jgi:hypothetical protein
VCCATGGGFVGTCDEGYACNNPPGEWLSNSECVAEAVTDATGDTSAAATTGGGETSAPVDASDASVSDAGETSVTTETTAGDASVLTDAGTAP